MWLHDDDNVPTIHHYTDFEIVHLVVSPEKNGSEEENSEGNEEDVREQIYVDRLIKLTTELLCGLRQLSFISEQEIMNVYLLQDQLIKERPKYVKQLTLHDIFKEIAWKHAEQEAAEMSTLDNPLPSTSSQPDVFFSILLTVGISRHMEAQMDLPRLLFGVGFRIFIVTPQMIKFSLEYVENV